MARESKNETYFKWMASLIGGVSEKHVSPGKKNVPDQIVSWPVDHFLQFEMLTVEWVELKADGKDATEAQKRDHARRRALGHRVTVLDSREKIEAWFYDRQLMRRARLHQDNA